MTNLNKYTDCPKCNGDKAIVYTDKFYFSYPEKFEFYCPCGYRGYCTAEQIRYQYSE